MKKRIYLSPSIRVRRLDADLLQDGVGDVSTNVDIGYGGEGGDDDDPRAKWGNIWDDSDPQDEE